MGIISYRENCPYCGKILYYELAERQKRLGNSLVSCPSCGKSYIDCCTYEWINLTDEEKKSVLVFGWNMTIVEETHVRKMYKRLYFTKFLLFGIPIVNKLKLQLDRLESFVYGLRIYDRWGENGEYNSVGVSSFYLTNKDGQRIDQLINTNERNKARTDDEITIHCEPSNQNFAVDYYILKYYNDDGSQEQHITTNTFNMLPNSIEVSVKMKLVEHTYNVNYVLGGGTIPPYAPRTFKSTDNTLAIPNPTREGYRFDGWEEQDSMHVSFLDGAIALYPYEFTEDLTLTAKWIKAATITYDYSHYSPYNLDGFNGKYVTDNNPTTYVLGETLILQNPIYAYGNFEGWYTSPTFEEESKITELYARPYYLRVRWRNLS